MRFYLTNFFKFLGNPVHQPTTKLRMSNLSPPEHYSYLDLVPILKEAASVLDFYLEVMFLGFRPHLDFFKLDPRRFFLRFSGSFARLVLVLAIVHDTADWRLGIWRYLDEIKPAFFGSSKSVGQTQDTKLVSLIIDNAKFPGTDRPVDIGFWLGYGNTS